MGIQYKNYVRKLLTANVLTTDTVINVDTNTGLPTISNASDYFYLVLLRLTDNKREIVRVTAVNSLALTVDRAQDGTTALTFSTGDRVELWLMSKALDDFRAGEPIQAHDDTEITSQTDANEINSLNNIISAAAGANISIELDAGNYTIDNNFTIPANIELILHNGACINVAATKVLTYDGFITAGTWNIFKGTGTVDATNLKNQIIYDAWWATPALAKTAIQNNTGFRLFLRSVDMVLDVLGGVKVGNTTITEPGIIRYDPTTDLFYTYDSSGNPKIIGNGFTDANGNNLSWGIINDLEFLKRSGNQIISAPIAPPPPPATLITGGILPWTTGVIPAGFLECNGAAVSRTTYSALFGVIASIYGNGDGTTTFNLPDYRGRFLRGTDNAAGIDPDSATRTDRGDGVIGDNVGTKQLDDFKSHNHNIQLFGGGAANTTVASGNASALGGQLTQNTGGNETRPVNINVTYIIKF